MTPFCPTCRSEYEQGIERCPECDAQLVEQMPPENPEAQPEAPLVEVYETSGDKEALVIRSLLESEGIVCSLSSDIPHSVIPVNVAGLGTVRITVSQKDAERAKEIIEEQKTEMGEEEEKGMEEETS